MFDVLTIAAVADELSATLLNGRVQRIGLVDPLTLAAEVYAGGRRHLLVASADNQDARLLLTAAPLTFDPALVTPFLLLLRKYVRGGVIVAIEQPPLERLVRVSIAKHLTPHNAPRPRSEDVHDSDVDDEEWPDEDGEVDATYTHLAVEVMGRHSNLILIDDDGRIMESVKRVTPSMSRVRPILPRLPYTPPPPVSKPDPRRLTAADAEELLRAASPDTELARLLVDRFRGISPQMAREIAFRVGGEARVKVGALPTDAAAGVARETRGLLEPLLTSAWAPRVYREAEEVVAFAPIPLAHLAAAFDEAPVASISVAIDEAAGGEAETPVRHAQRRERLSQSIRTARERLQGRVASLRAEEAKAAEAEQLRAWGDLIYGYLWQIQPGQRELTVDGVTVPLDPNLSAKENAQEYFERYRKARNAAVQLPDLLAQVEHELAYFDQLLTMTAQAASFAEIEALTAEWASHGGGGRGAGGTPTKKRRAAPARPRPLIGPGGHAIYIGRSGAQNDMVTFDLAGPDDTWLHARGVAGSHVIVRWRSPGADEDPATIDAAAALAAHYSAARGSATVEVDVTRRRHVRKIKGTGPGMVTYRNERTIAVRPADEAALKGVVASG